MKRVREVLLGMISGLLLLVPGIAQDTLPPFEPPTVAVDEVVSTLCQVALEDGAASVREQAIVAVMTIDPEGRIVLPIILEVLESSQSSTTKLSNALDVLRIYGPAAATAVPILVRLRAIADWNLDQRIARTLDAIGTPRLEDLEALIALLSHESALVRDTAASEIAKLGPQASSAITALIERLEDADPRVREAAARALGAMGEAAAVAVPRLIELASDEVSNVRSAAWRALDSIGTPRIEDIEEIRELLNSQNTSVVAAAAKMLGALGPQAREAVPDLICSLEKAPTTAATALGEILHDVPTPPDELPQRAVDALVEMLNAESACVRFFAAEALGEIGPAANAAFARLVALLDDSEWCSGYWSVSSEARRALEHIGTPRVEDVDELISLLTGSQNRNIKEWAARGLGELGPAAKPAVPYLIELYASGWGVQELVPEMLDRIGPLSPEDIDRVDVEKRLLAVSRG